MWKHFKYTGNRKWISQYRTNILKACHYLLDWRKRNLKPELKGKGYGMIEGRVGDPEDFFHSFMLNAVSQFGTLCAAELLETIGEKEARTIRQEAIKWQKDIVENYKEVLKKSPLIPVGKGEWIPSAPCWAEYAGPVALFAQGGTCFTHGTFTARDSLTGPLYLLFFEVMPYDDKIADWMIKAHNTLFTIRNAALSQPYYSRHDYIHLLRGEVKHFLKTYYNQLALQDRETYTFWEHYFGISPHKTHEEAWFLLQTKWMLWLERDNTLKLLAGIPRKWFTLSDRTIELKNVASYFGKFDFMMRASAGLDLFEAYIEFKETRLPERIEIGCPHPMEKKPEDVSIGTYDATRETIIINKPHKKMLLSIKF